MIRNLYVAAPWIHRLTARQTAQELREAGFEITSRWHDEWGTNPDHPQTADTLDPVTAATEAAMDFTDVLCADAMVVLNLSKSEGKAVEQGIALTAQLPVVVVGSERFNVFQYLDTFHLVPDLPAAIAFLRTLTK